MALFDVHDLSRVYRRGRERLNAVDIPQLVLRPRESVAIVGPSGSGKTTLLQLLGGLDRPSTGSIQYAGLDLASQPDRSLTRLRVSDFGFVFQQFCLIPTLTARQQIETALSPSSLNKSDRSDRAAGLLEAVGLSARARHLPGQLSGGEQQRIAIARALANSPKVLLADEPIGSLDADTGDEILNLLFDFSRQDRVLIVVTHNQRVARRADRIIELRSGRIALDSAA